MTTDKEGHLWCSHPNKGITEYNPKQENMNTIPKTAH
jgi:sugar lactone lactonase YvrE